MSAAWKQLRERIDKLSLRERALVFGAVALTLVLTLHALLLLPLLRQQRAHVEKIKQDESQLASVRQVLLKLASEPAKPDSRAAKLARVRDLEQRLAQSERLLAEARTGQLTPAQLPSLLRDVLGKGANVRILSIRTRPSVAMAAGPVGPPAKPGAPPSAAAPASPGPSAYRHGVEIEAAGEYLDLLKYVENIEALPIRLAWGEIDLKVEKYPEVRLKATLHALSAQATLLGF